MSSATRRGVYGGIGAGVWIAGAVATAPLTGDTVLVGIAQTLIEVTPGAIATAAIDTLGKLAQPGRLAAGTRRP